MREYNQEELARIKQMELDIYKDFKKVCEEHNLTYCGLAGTGIGAIRHKGFIPWDDDIDVGLPREDYEKLNAIFKEKFSDKYIVCNVENYENYPLMTTRIMVKGTRFVEDTFKGIKDKCPLGIFLDVYAFDNVSDNNKEFKRQAWTAWFYSKLMILRSIPKPILPFKGVKAKLAYCICGIVHGFLVLFRVNNKKIYKRYKKVVTKYNDKQTGRMAFMADTSPFYNIIDKKKAFPLVEMEFEDTTMMFPANIDEMLRYIFGDYMVMPPVDKRKNHHPYILDFGPEEK